MNQIRRRDEAPSFPRRRESSLDARFRGHDEVEREHGAVKRGHEAVKQVGAKAWQ